MGLWDGFASGLWRRTYDRLPYIFNRDEDNLMSLVRGFAAEFFGMCVWIFLACGSVPAVEATLGTLSIKPDSLLVISISFGVGICIPIYMFAEISGANFNPAVSFSLWLLQRQSFIRLCIYIVAQLSGSILAACLLRFVITNAQDHVSALGATHIAPGIDWVKGMYIETLLTSILIFCVVGTAVHPFGRTVHHKEKWSHLGAGVNTGVVVGMIIFALNIVGIPATGASMNPARSFGPAFVSWDWDGHTIYWLGPFLGAIIGTLCALIFMVRPEGRIPSPYTDMEEYSR